MKGCIMSEERKCLKCGGTNVKPGAIESTGKIYARPNDAKLDTFLTTGALVNVNICFDCGYIELIGDTDKLKSLIKAS